MITQFFQAIIEFIGQHPNAAIAIVFLISAGEALFVIGLFFPSTVVLVGAGTLVGLGKLDFLPIYLSASLGAVAGDTISYWFGHHYKERVRLIWPFSRYTNLLDQGETYFARHGGKSVFIGRFIPGVKAVVPGVAGIVGMNPLRFAIINVVSAFVWAAVHLLPGMGVGHAVDATAVGNPRLLEAILLIGLIVTATWYLTRFAFQWAMPHLATLRSRIADSAGNSSNAQVRTIGQTLSGENGIFAPFILAVVALVAVAGFLAIAFNIYFDPEFVRADTAISNYIRGLRTPALDQVMIPFTMLGDGKVLSFLALAMVAVVAWNRRWRLAGVITLAFVSASVFVPVVKTLIHRARPNDLYSGAESFSFPSGHATLSATIIGIAFVLGVHSWQRRYRFVAFFLAAIMIILIAFSRVYLGAHWPSDVIAGVSFGIAVVFVIAFLTHERLEGRISRQIGVTTLFVALLAFGLHFAFNLPAAKAFYAYEKEPVAISQTSWLAKPLSFGSKERILLDGEYGERMIIQTDLPIAEIDRILTDAGWTRDKTGPVAGFVDIIIPRSSKAKGHPNALPRTHRGTPPFATFVKEFKPGEEAVLRFWRTGTLIKMQSGELPLLTASVSGQATRSLPFNMTVPRASTLKAAEIEQIAANVSGLLANLSPSEVSNVGGLRVVPRPN